MMEQLDLTFRTKTGVLNYRVGAIIICGKKVLMVKNPNSSYYYSVGGRVKLNETSEEAVMREVFEETGLHLQIDRLGFIHENFFTNENTKEIYHELALFYYMKTDKEVHLVSNSFTEQGEKESLHWIPLENITDIYLFPEFFKTKLLNPTNEIQHIITRE